MSTKEELLNIINDVPIYFASTHGAYDLRNDVVQSFIVPPNTYIFQASSIGEATMTTIDEPLWNILQNREELINYLSSSEKTTNEVKKQVIKNLCYYKPGDIIFKRTLVLEDDNEYDYAWGYYKFSKGDKAIPFPESPEVEKDKPLVIPPEPANPPFTDVMKSFRTEHFPPGRVRLRGFERIDTGSDIRFISETRKRDNNNGPAIFIFSSCASFWSSDDKDKDVQSILAIGRTQQQANLNFAEMGFTSGIISGENKMPVLLGANTRNIQPRRSKSMPQGFSKISILPAEFKLTTVEPEELKYLEMIGEKMARFVRPRFKTIQVPKGASSIFKKISEGTYIISKSPSGKTWWTSEEIQNAIDKKEEIYVYIGGKWIQLKIKAGIYTASLRQDPKKKVGSSRRFLKKSKKTRKVRKIKKFP